MLGEKVSVIIPHFYAARWPNLQVIASALREGAVVPHEILIWNNEAGALPAIDGAQVIQSHRNVGCLARFVASLVAQGDWLLYHDNDMLCAAGTVQDLVMWAQRLGESIVSVDGWNFVDAKRSYAAGVNTYFTGQDLIEPRRVDVVPGHIELVRKDVALRILATFPFIDAPEHDDLVWNACAERLGIPRYVVPSKSSWLSDYGLGISREPGFNDRRDQLCRELWA
jgi:hypothetical protein